MRFFLISIFFFALNIGAKIIVIGNEFVSVKKILAVIDPILDENIAISNLLETGLFDEVSINKDGSDFIVIVKEKCSVENIIFCVNGKMYSKKLHNSSWEELCKACDCEAGLIDTQKILLYKARLKQYFDSEKRYERVCIVHKIEKNNNNNYDLIFDIQAENKLNVPRVIFIGNDKLTAKELEESMMSKTKNYIIYLDKTPEPYLLEANLSNIIIYAKNKGFLKAKIKTSFIKTENYKRQIYIAIEEGPLFKFGNIKIITDPFLPELKTNFTFSNIAYFFEINLFIQILRNEYAKNNMLVNIDYEEIYRENVVDLIFKVSKTEKPKIISEIFVTNNTITRKNVILKAACLEKGSCFDLFLLKTAETKIKALGFFEYVTVVTKKDFTGNDIVIIDVKEKSSGSIFLAGSIGFSNSSESFPLSATLAYNDPNFLGTGNNFLLDVTIGNIDKRVMLSYTKSNVRNSNVDWRNDFYVKMENQIALKIDKLVIFEQLPKKQKYEDSVGYSIDKMGISSSGIFDCFGHGSFILQAILEGQYFSHDTFKPGKQIRVFDQNHFPNSRLLGSVCIIYKYGKIFRRKKTLTLTLPLSLNVTSLMTSFLKFEPSLSFIYSLKNNVVFKSELSVGGIHALTDRYHWVDNFQYDDLYVRGITRIGPVEKYRWTPIGGKCKINAFAEISIPLIFSNHVNISCFAGLYCGIIFNSSLQQYVMQETVSTLDEKQDIASNGLHPRLSAAVGVRIRPTNLPFNFEFSLDWPIYYQSSDRIRYFNWGLTIAI